MAQSPKPIQLKPATLEGFERYINEIESAMEPSLHTDQFLWSEASAERTQQLHAGKVIAQFWSGKGPIKIEGGLIHDWIGAVFIHDVAVRDVLTLLQDYDNHKKTYRPEVIESKLIGHRENDFQVYLRILKKKVLTVVLDTDHQVHYEPVDGRRWICRSSTTRVAEVENAGTPNEHVRPADTGYGFLWRLYSYWRFAERDNGVCVECRAVSLTRDVPFGLGWIIEPIIQKLPKESLVHTLEATRQGLNSAR